MVLLGAGASIEAGVPGAYSIVDRLYEVLDPKGKGTLDMALVHFVVGGIAFKRGVQRDYPLEPVDIEELFSTIETLSDRFSSDLAPFVGSWHSRLTEFNSHAMAWRLALLLEDAERNWSGQWAAVVKAAVEGRLHGARADYLHSHDIRDVLTGLFAHDREDAYLSQAKQRLITALKHLLWIEKRENVAYMIPLVRWAARTGSTIVTLNYDLAIEMACEMAGIAVDRDARWTVSRRSSQAVRLVKLHGSLDWCYAPDTDLKVAAASIEQIRDDKFRPAIVFGKHNKLRSDGPYLDLLFEYENSLMRADRLTVIGYSFRDDHINRAMEKWQRSRKNTILRVVNGPGFRLDDYDFLADLQYDCKSRVIARPITASAAIEQYFAR